MASYNVIRLLATSLDFSGAWVAANNDAGLDLRLWSNSDTRFQVAIGNADGTINTDVGSIGQIRVGIYGTTGTGNTVVLNRNDLKAEQTDTGVDTALTDATWKDGTAQHAEVDFSAAELNLAAGTYALNVEVTRSGGEVYIAQAAYFDIVEGGSGASGSAPTPTATYYTKAETIAAFSANTKVSDTIFVDGTYGDNTSGTRERFDKPFATITAATAAASASDTIWIHSGTYAEKITSLSVALNFHLEAGAYWSGVSGIALDIGSGSAGIGIYGDGWMGAVDLTGWTGTATIATRQLTGLTMSGGTVNVRNSLITGGSIDGGTLNLYDVETEAIVTTGTPAISVFGGHVYDGGIEADSAITVTCHNLPTIADAIDANVTISGAYIDGDGNIIGGDPVAQRTALGVTAGAVYVSDINVGGGIDGWVDNYGAITTTAANSQTDDAAVTRYNVLKAQVTGAAAFQFSRPRGCVYKNKLRVSFWYYLPSGNLTNTTGSYWEAGDYTGSNTRVAAVQGAWTRVVQYIDNSASSIRNVYLQLMSGATGTGFTSMQSGDYVYLSDIRVDLIECLDV